MTSSKYYVKINICVKRILQGVQMGNQKMLGIMYAVSAYILWGLFPLYWKLVSDVFSVDILAHRVLWAFVLMVIVITCTRQWKVLKSIASDRKQLLYIFMAGILVTANWGIYIWAVNANRILDASLGYYINPLISVALGVIIFKEKLNGWQRAALSIASIGVIILTVQHGKFPWVSLSLALTFGLYGAIKKLVKANSIIGLALETAAITPIAMMYIVAREVYGQGVFGNETLSIALLLIGGGVVTAVPLLLFAEGAKRIPLSTLGFTQYASPTISLLLGIFMYHEKFTMANMISFCFIWFALIIYSISQLRLMGNKEAVNKEVTVNNELKDVS